MCEEKEGGSKMSLYNSMFGVNKEMPELLGMIGVNAEYFSRFRDVDLTNKGTTIRVFTRLGGGNREYFQEIWNKIRKHELYIKDYDDDFDCTYAYIEFKVPENYKETAKRMFKGEPKTFEEKFKKELEEMDKPGTKAFETSERIVRQIVNAIENGNGMNIIKI